MNKKYIIIIISIILLLIISIYLLSEKDNNITKVTGSEARQILKDNPNNSILIDVRTFQEFYDNGITGSINIPYDEIKQKIQDYDIDQNTRIILYCNSGKRSNKAAQTLKSLGYKYIFDLGSISNW